MKKLIFGIVCMFALSMGFASCGSNAGADETVAASDSIEVVDSLDVDSLLVDSVAVDSAVVAE